MMMRVTGKLGAFRGHPMIEHFRFVQAQTKRAAKMTIPSPSSMHFRYGRDAVPIDIYPAMEDFYRDLGEVYRKTVRAFADAGCRYLQLDEVQPRVSVRSGSARESHRTRGRSRSSAVRLCRHDQCRDLRHSR